MPKVIVSEKALREMVREALSSTGWSGEGNSSVVAINPITDPSAPVTDPINPNFTPQNKTEFGVAMGQLVKNLPDTDLPGVFNAVKKALDTRSEKDEIDAATQAAMVAGSQEAIDSAGKTDMQDPDKKDKHEGKMPTMNDVEAKLRARIRKAILEAHGLTEADLKEAGPKFDWSKAPAPTNPHNIQPRKIPAGTMGGEATRRAEKTAADLKKSLGKSVDRYESGEDDARDEDEPNLPDEESGESEKDPSKYKFGGHQHAHQEIGSLGQVGGASFEDIAKAADMSVSGAKQAVDKALLRFKFLHQAMQDDPEAVEIMVLTAMNDYINMLNKTGELTAADVQLMKDHPDVVRELDGFRDYLHNTIKRTMKGGQKLYDPLEDDDESPEEEAPESGEEEAGTDAAVAAATGASPSAPGEPAAPAPKAGKTSYKIYGKMKGAPAHTRLKGKAYVAPQDTQFTPGELANITADNGKLKVKKPDSDHTQTWEPADQANEMDEADPAQIKGKSVADPKAPAPAPSKPGDKSAKMASGKKASIDWGGFDECARLKSPLLSEAAAMVMSDTKGPYVIADGVEVRPVNPNRTHYRAGAKVNVHRHGVKGIFIVEMPNGEKWTNKLQEAPKKGKK